MEELYKNLNKTSSALAYKPWYPYVFPFEDRFSYKYWGGQSGWMGQHWHYTIHLSIVYVLCIFGVQYWMKTRKPYSLRGALTLWNISLAAFSFFGACRMWTELVYLARNFGLQHTVCNCYYQYSTAGLWSLLFVTAKAPELVDTFFVVLRKQKLIFLHWYHHITVMMYCWWSAQYCCGSPRYFITLNYTVHAIMYLYYALRAARVKVPRVFNIFITSLQIFQMIVGFITGVAELYLVSKGKHCTTENTAVINVSLAMYASYFVLFMHYFNEAYIKTIPRKKVD